MSPHSSPEQLVGRQPAHYDPNAAATAGLGGGLAAGVFLAALRLGLDAALGDGVREGIRRWGAVLVEGEGRAALLVGLGAHLCLSLAFGLAFGLASFAWQRGTVLWGGPVYGCLVYAFMSFLALPAVAPGLVGEQLSLPWALGHVAFGLVLALVSERLRFVSVTRAGLRHPGRTITIAPHARSH